jgi:hypothetical protein
VTIDIPRQDAAFDVSAKQLGRRQLVKAGAWAAPVVLLAVATPPASASPGPVPSGQLTVTANALSSAAPAVGPLSWAGGSILWTKVGTGEPTLATVTYSVTLTGPGGLSYDLYTGVQNVAPGGTITFPVTPYGVAPLAPGAYRVTITAVSDGTASAQSNPFTIIGVPVDQLSVQAYQLGDSNSGGTPGPLSWSGGQIGWWSAPPSGEPSTAVVAWTAVLTGPDALSVTLASGTANISRYGSFTIPASTWGTKPIASGAYTVTVTATTSSSKSVNSNVVTVASTVKASTPTVTGVKGNKHKIDFTLTGPPKAVVDIVATGTDASLNPNFPASVTIPATGSIAVTGTANATGKTAGSVSIALTARTGWIVTPTTLGPLEIPVTS